MKIQTKKTNESVCTWLVVMLRFIILKPSSALTHLCAQLLITGLTTNRLSAKNTFQKTNVFFAPQLIYFYHPLEKIYFSGDRTLWGEYCKSWKKHEAAVWRVRSEDVAESFYTNCHFSVLTAKLLAKSGQLFPPSWNDIWTSSFFLGK